MASVQEITVTERDRLWPLVSLLIDTHYDDVTDALPELMDVVRKYRFTDADGNRVDRGSREAQS